MEGIATLVIVAIVMFAVLGAISVLAHIYNLNNIKSKTVGDGQHGTARWARKEEIKHTYKHIPFRPDLWRKGKNLPPPDAQGIVVGCNSSKTDTTAMVDTGDVHALMKDIPEAQAYSRFGYRKYAVLPTPAAPIIRAWTSPVSTIAVVFPVHPTTMP